MTKTIVGKGLKIVLDRSEVFPDDPGAGTPAMVYDAKGNCATFHVAMNEGELECGDVRLTAAQTAWLASQENAVINFLEW